MRRAEYKVKGGKLIKCRLELDNNYIKHVTYTGDFFLHPEESVEELERNLVGAKASKDEIERIISGFFRNPRVTLIGASPQDFISVTSFCIEGSINGS